jgi:hypothetical protein
MLVCPVCVVFAVVVNNSSRKETIFSCVLLGSCVIY